MRLHGSHLGRTLVAHSGQERRDDLEIIADIHSNLFTEHVAVVLLENVGNERGLHHLLHVVHVALAQHAHHQRARHRQQQVHSLAHVLRLTLARLASPTRTV